MGPLPCPGRCGFPYIPRRGVCSSSPMGAVGPRGCQGGNKAGRQCGRRPAPAGLHECCLHRPCLGLSAPVVDSGRRVLAPNIGRALAHVVHAQGQVALNAPPVLHGGAPLAFLPRPLVQQQAVGAPLPGQARRVAGGGVHLHPPGLLPAGQAARPRTLLGPACRGHVGSEARGHLAWGSIPAHPHRLKRHSAVEAGVKRT